MSVDAPVVRGGAGGTGRHSTRAEAQRDRILSAAYKCFVERGFHAASMANIADTAGMSAGLIYRYFKSKHEIILAIIERELAERRADIAQLSASTDMVEAITALFSRWRDGDPQVTSAALFLEMTAEGSREPKMAEALRRSDRISRNDFCNWLAKARGDGGLGLPSESAEERALVLECLVGGLAIRALREPDLDLGRLRAALGRVLPALLQS